MIERPSHGVRAGRAAIAVLVASLVVATATHCSSSSAIRTTADGQAAQSPSDSGDQCGAVRTTLPSGSCSNGDVCRFTYHPQCSGSELVDDGAIYECQCTALAWSCKLYQSTGGVHPCDGGAASPMTDAETSTPQDSGGD